MALADETAALLDLAVDAFGDRRPELADARRRLDEPLRVAIAGKVKAGKSTLLNALVGEELAPTDAGECTRIVTWYRNGHTYRLDAVLGDGTRRQLPFHRDDGAIEPDFGDLAVDDVRSLDVMWPSGRLGEMTLIDTPGIESINVDVSQRTIDFLTGDDAAADTADAVLYLMRHTHRDDVRFLESFHDRDIAHASPVNAIGVLSRADEVGACRLDALDSAERIAGRYRDDPKLRRLCQTVLPVAGLLAQAASTLRETEYRAFATLAGEADDSIVWTAADFVADDPTIPVTAIEREDLLDRFGLYGVRVAIDLIRRGEATTAGALAQTLLDRSGLPGLRTALLDRFAGRADTLRARSALAVLEAVLLDESDVPDSITMGHERILAGAHELEELRLLNQLHLGVITFKPDDLGAAEGLLTGSTAAARLGLGGESSPAEIQAAAVDQLGRWQSRAESPMAAQQQKDAARTLVRSLEGIIAGAGA